jgi:hypothetical protein
MTTKRTPRKREARPAISPAVIEAFKAMGAARYGSETWWRAHDMLHDSLRLPPWVFPFDGNEEELIWPNGGTVTTVELWRELERAPGAPPRSRRSDKTWSHRA